MCKRVFCFALSLGVCFNAPVWAQSANETAKKLGQRGVYGTNSVDGESEDGAIEEIEPEEELTEEEKRLRAKYPLSTTSRTSTNQDAHLHMMEGIRLYYRVRKMFEEIKNINGDFDKDKHILKITQKGIIQAMILPEDILRYGPENAHIGIRIRALQDAVILTEESIQHFSAAQGLAPTVAILERWLRITRDTRKALRFHIAYYNRAYEAMQAGATEAQLEFMAKMWKSSFNLKPQDTLTTSIPTMMFEMMRRQEGLVTETENKEQAKDLDGLINSLPTLDFKIDS